MPSVHKTPILIPSSTLYHGGLCSHRLKQIEKWFWREHSLEYIVRMNVLTEAYSNMFCFHYTNTCMDNSTRVISVSKGNSCELYVNNHGSEKSYVEKQQEDLGDTIEAIVESEALDMATINDSGTVLNIGVDAVGSFHASECFECASLPNPICEQKNTYICNEINLCQGFQSLSLDPKVERSFNKSATFPSSKETCSVSLIASIQDERSSGSETPAYARPVSLPTSMKLVSAMKGGRAQNGISLKADLRVKWASEVYDPPCTSLSHTVNNHRQRPKTKKKDNRKNKNKGKSTRGSGGSVKLSSNQKYASGQPGPSTAGLRASVSNVLLVGGHDANCASSFLREMLPKVHSPVGEAS